MVGVTRGFDYSRPEVWRNSARVIPVKRPRYRYLCEICGKPTKIGEPCFFWPNAMAEGGGFRAHEKCVGDL